MTVLPREELAQIAQSKVSWPETLSGYFTKLFDDRSTDDGLFETVSNDHWRMMALITSLFDDADVLLHNYFADMLPGEEHMPYSEITEDVITRIYQSLQQVRDSPELAVKKVQLGAIQGIWRVHSKLEDGFYGAYWGSTRLDQSPETVREEAESIWASFSNVDVDILDLDERRKVITAQKFLKALAIKDERYKGGPSTLKNNLREVIADLYNVVVSFEEDPTGMSIVSETVQDLDERCKELKNPDKHLPYAVGRVAGASKAQELYVERREILI